MSITTENNKRIAKNTLFLYFRMILIMLVTLYTSRLILKILGVENYGIYNVVGGVIAMLGFLKNTLSGASSRFFTYELGRKNGGNPQKMFSVILFVHFLLATIIAIIGETIGLWFVCEKLVIPNDRMTAALWVYHCSILTTVVSIISVPYNSLIIAHEKMKAFAYISIVEVLLKLLIVFILGLIPFDNLIIYALLILMIQIFIRMIYYNYCVRNFSESNTCPRYDRHQIKEIFSYMSWTMNGSLAVVGYTHGINILLNLFFGPIVNAARGIAVQVQSAVMSFIHNFQTAMRPQIIKNYASNNLEYMHTLIIASSKYAFFMMLILIFPIIILINPILYIWLDEVPKYTADFVTIMLLAELVQPLSLPLKDAIHATGNIRKFQIYEGSFLLLVLPITYCSLRFLKISPQNVMVIYLIISYLAQVIRVWIVLPQIRMEYKLYINSVIFPILLPVIITLTIAFYISIPFNVSWVYVVASFMILMTLIILCIYWFGLNMGERNYIKSQTMKLLTYSSRMSNKNN